MSDPVKAIARRLQRLCKAIADTSIREERSHGWQSLLFDGGRHRIALALSGERVDEAIGAIHEEIGRADFMICGHLIADIRVAGIERGANDTLVTVEALTIAA